MTDVVIASACRTAVGAFGGTLKDSSAHAMASTVIREAVKRAGIDPALVDDVRLGSCMEHPDTLNIARVAALLGGIPDTATAATVNRVCISGMEAVISGAAMIKAGMADVIVAGGVEHMSGVPYSLDGARWGYRLQDNVVMDTLIHALRAGSVVLPGIEGGPVADAAEPAAMFKGKPYIMGHTAEFVAQMYNISRQEMDEVALRSHNNVERANKEGDFKDEIVPVALPQKRGKPPLQYDKDEHFRPGLTMEQLAALPPAFIPKTGKVTAGNSSGLNDGASAVVILSAEKAKELGLKPLARIREIGRGGCHPSVMGISPIPAVKNLLERDGKLKAQDFELIEMNEAFAAQYIACERDLGLDRERVNINGGGIGMGHPVGSTGCRLIVTLIHALRKQGKTLGMATLCGGGGVSMAIAIEIL